MWRRIRNWWNDNALLWFTQGFLGVLRGLFRVKEAFAPPEKQAKYREFREKMEQIERDKNTVLRDLDDLSHKDRDRREEVWDKFDAFSRKYGGERNENIRQEHRAKIRAMHTESDTLQQIRAEYKDDPDRAIATFRTYANAHPGERMPLCYLVSALREARRFDEAIAVCQESLAHTAPSEVPKIASVNRLIELLTIGTLLTEKGDTRGAIFHLERLIATADEDADFLLGSVYLALGEAYEKNGNRDAAKKAWREAVKRDTTGTIKKQVGDRLP